MLSYYVLYLFFSMIYFTYCQSTIRIGIIDDNDNPKGFVRINVPNVTFCGHENLYLQLYWINTSISLFNLINQLEFEQSLTNIYLTNTMNFYTKLIQDFCRTN